MTTSHASLNPLADAPHHSAASRRKQEIFDARGTHSGADSEDYNPVFRETLELASQSHIAPIAPAQNSTTNTSEFMQKPQGQETASRHKKVLRSRFRDQPKHKR